MRKMKNSGVLWIGEIPSSWAISKVSRHFDIQLGKMLQPTQDNATDTLEDYLCAANIGKNTLNLETIKQMWIQDKERETFLAKPGDLMVVEGGDIASSAILSSIKPLYFQNSLHRVRAVSDFDVRFLRYILMTAKANGHVDLICNKATIAHFTKEKFGAIAIPVTSPQEQQHIADFLDRKCSVIDSVLKENRAIIEEYKRLKESVITEAITKGIRGERPMKESGIEWIGKIPEDWGKDKIVRLFKTIGSGTTPKSSQDSSFQGSINWIQSGDINGGLLNSCKNTISENALNEYSALKVYRSPFIIMAMYGASIGNISISTIDGCVNQACCVMSDSEVDSHYVFYALKSSKDYLVYKANGGGQPNISQETLKQLWIPKPPTPEQQEIATFLDKKCSEIDSLIASKEKFITELESYKKSLIYEYVTGKKEVPSNA